VLTDRGHCRRWRGSTRWRKTKAAVPDCWTTAAVAGVNWWILRSSCIADSRLASNSGSAGVSKEAAADCELSTVTASFGSGLINEWRRWRIEGRTRLPRFGAGRSGIATAVALENLLESLEQDRY